MLLKKLPVQYFDDFFIYFENTSQKIHAFFTGVLYFNYRDQYIYVGFFSLFFQTPLKLDAVKALRKEPVVETKIPFVRESKQATHLYVPLVSLKKNQLD